MTREEQKLETIKKLRKDLRDDVCELDYPDLTPCMEDGCPFIK